MTSSPVLKPHIDPDADGTFDSHYYPHATVDAALALKADQTALDATNTTVATKADSAAVAAVTPVTDGTFIKSVGGTATEVAVETEVAATAAVQAKADQTALATTNTTVATKATQRAVDVVEQGTPFTGGGDAGPGVMAAIVTAGGNSGRTSAALATMDKPVTIPSGIYDVGTEIAVSNTWRHVLAGAGGQQTQLKALNDLSTYLYFDGCGYGLVEGLCVNAATTVTVQDVLSVDRTAAAVASVHMFTLRDFAIVSAKFVRGISLGRNSANLDMAQIFADTLYVQGAWASGEATYYQEGLHLGNTTTGNVLNFSVEQAQIGGVATGVWVGAVNTTLRDIFLDTGDVAFAGLGRHYLSVDGWRIEDFNQFCAFTGVDSIHRNYTFRNGNYNDTGAGVHTAANFERAGHVTFQDVIWNTANYATGARSQIRTNTSPSVSRRLTFRNFLAKEKPEELWLAGAADDWKRVWMIFDGYTIASSSLQGVQEITGLYSRAITASMNVQPYDGILLADTTGAAITVTLPPATWHVGREIVLRKTAGANTLTLAATSPDLIDGAATVAVTGTTRVRSLGTSWMVL